MMRLQVEHLSVQYNGHPALVDVSLLLPAGTICALVGVNGAGKSTLFKALMGLVSPSAGLVRIDGLPVNEAQARQRLAYVPQAEAVDWDFPLTVGQLVMMGRYGHQGLLRIPAAHDREVVRQAMERVDLWPLRQRQIGQLSGGQRKRVFLARALAQQATLLLLDEPFTGVDGRSEELLISLLKELRAQQVTVLIASHDLTSLPLFCDRAVLLQRSVLAEGPAATVLSHENLARSFGPPARPVVETI